VEGDDVHTVVRSMVACLSLFLLSC